MTPTDSSLTVSVCMLCYNQAHLIADAVRAVLAQTRPADEILVVDDGSTDKSPEVLRSFAGIQVIVHPENRGRAAARSTLLEAASGDIVVYLDGDVIAEPDVVAMLLREYRDPSVGAVGGRGIPIGGTGVADRWRRRHVSQEHPQWTALPSHLFGVCFSARASLVRDLGGWRPGAEEVDLGHRIRRHGYKLVFTPSAAVRDVRTDTFRSLMEQNWRWWCGGYLARTRNGMPALLPFLRYAIAEFVKYLREDIWRRRDLALVPIDVAAFAVRLAAIVRASAWRTSTWPPSW